MSVRMVHPHVIEPAFGIDRIIWHVLDHAYEEAEKEGEDYTFLRLAEGISASTVWYYHYSTKKECLNWQGDYFSDKCTSTF